MPGPSRTATKPNSRARRNTGGSGNFGFIELPAGGCDLPVPRLPAGRAWSAEERKLWRNLWRSPQATQWDDSYIAAVAAYVVHASAIYDGTAKAWSAQEFRHLGDKLGLTPQGMANLGWMVR